MTALADSMTDVAASDDHTMVVCTGGQLWTFGWNDEGQLGTGDREQEHTVSPHLVTSFSPHERVVQAAAGVGHSLVLMESGAVYSWGRGAYGQLGHGDEEGQLLPRRIEALAGERVVRVDANGWGVGLSAVTTSEGAVFMFGKGVNRALGLEDEECHALPTRVAALPKGVALVDMALGGDPDDGSSWSVVTMRGGGIVGESLYRWGVLNVVDPDEEEAPHEGSSVVAWPL